MSDEDNPIDTQIDQPIEPKGVSEDQMRQEMAHVYDRVTASTAKTEADAIVPSILPGDSTQAAMEKTWDYLHASPQEQATQREASRLVEQVRDNAAKFGVTLDDKAAMKAAMKLEAEQANSTPSVPAELQPALKSIAELYPNRAPHEVANEYAQIDRDFKRDPLNVGFRMLQEQTGMSPLEIARQVAMAQSPQQTQMFHAERDVNTFFDLVPEAAKLQPQMIAAIERGEIQRTGNIIADMKRVYEHVRGKPQGSRKGGSRSMESEMEETYRRVNSR